jgi:sugar phosphate isomerase/epimerase
MHAQIFGNEKAFETIKACGYDACDFGLGLPKSPLEEYSTEDFEMLLKTFENYRKIAQEIGVDIYQTHSNFYFNLDSYEEDYAKAYIKQKRQEMKASKTLGSNIMVIHPVQPYGWKLDPTPEKTADWNIKILTELAKIAEDENLVLALENMPAHVQDIPCASPESLLSYINGVDSEYLKICFDTGHANMARLRIPGKNYTCSDYVKMFGDKIVCLHVHENSGNNDEHNMMMTTPSPSVNWPETIQALKDVGYKGTFNSEANFSARLPKELFLEAEKLQCTLFKTVTEKYGFVN